MDIHSALAGVGHNRAPTVEVFKERVDRLVDVANRWLTERPVITDEDMAAKCTDFLDQIIAESKAVEEQRKTEKSPHDQAAKAVDAKYKPLTNLLETAKAMLRPRLSAWLQKKEVARQEAARKAEAEAFAKMQAAEELRLQAAQSNNIQVAVAAEEATERANEAIAQADQVSNSRAQVRGDYSTRARSLRSQWKARVVDLPKALEHYRAHPDVLACVEKLANQDARHGSRDLPGCEVFQEQQVA